jgi:hypothetical protein
MLRAAPLAALTAFISAPAFASGVELDFGGLIQSNVRYRPDDKSVGGWYDRTEQKSEFVRNEHILKLKVNAGYDRFQGVVDADFVWTGFTRAQDLEDLSFRETVEPNRLEVHSAYLEGSDVFFEGLDLRLGQQIVSWGVADQFNPTNNLNADDLEDRLLFGVQQANLMARADYTVEDWFTFSGVLVPLFKPALLPKSAAVGLKSTDRLPMVDAALRRRIHAEQGYAGLNDYPTLIQGTELVVPEPTWRNMQFSFRLAFNLGEHDVALSYYNGRSDIPLPVSNALVQTMDPRCNPDAPTECIAGSLDTRVALIYPHMQVAGLNMAGELDLFGWLSEDVSPLGYRFELGVYFPSEYRIEVQQGAVSLMGFEVPGREYDYNGPDAPGSGERPVVLSDRPYAKWTLGLDYTFDEHWYVNAMWVHGLADEDGAGDWLGGDKKVRQGGLRDFLPTEFTPDTPDARSYVLANCANPLNPDGTQCSREVLRNSIGDYLVLGVDFKWSGGDGLFRLFTIWDLTGYVEDTYDPLQRRRVERRWSPVSKEGFSLVLFPELNYNFGGGFELGGGALVQLGRTYTKFGDPAAGGSLIWTRARYSF